MGPARTYKHKMKCMNKKKRAMHISGSDPCVSRMSDLRWRDTAPPCLPLASKLRSTS